jgi:hypothetical protein
VQEAGVLGLKHQYLVETGGGIGVQALGRTSLTLLRFYLRMRTEGDAPRFRTSCLPRASQLSPERATGAAGDGQRIVSRGSLTRRRQRMGEEKVVALIQESLAAAARTGAANPADFCEVIVDTTLQPKAVAFPTDAKLMHRARERLVRLAKKTGVSLRQSYERVGKRALFAHQRYAHATQFKRANRALKTIRTYLGRVPRPPLERSAPFASMRLGRLLPSGCPESIVWWIANTKSL